MNTEPRKFGFVKTLIFSLIITGVAFILLDWVSSYMAFPTPRIETPPRSHYFEFDPLLMWRLRPGYRDDMIAISEDGFRCDERIVPGSGRKLVFVLGGSSVFGLGVREDQTLSAFLQRFLDARAGDQRFQVVNAGVTGYFSTQELILAHRKLLAYAPSVIVALTGRNDVFYALHPAYKVDEIPYHGLIRGQVGALDPYFTAGEGREPRLHAMRLMGRMFQAVVEEDWAKEWSGPALKSHPEAIGNFTRNERALHAMLSGLGVDYHLFLQPIISWPPRKQSPEELALPKSSYLDALTEGYRQFIDETKRTLEGEWFHALLALPELEEDELFIDNVHFSEVGAKEAARIIARELVGEVGTPRISLADKRQAIFLAGGWHEQEGDYRWTRRSAKAILRCPAPGRQGLRFCLSGNAGQVGTHLRISFGNNLVLESDLKGGEELNLSAIVPNAWAGTIAPLTMELSRTWIPKEIGLNQDPRQLGVLIRGFGFEPVE